MKVNKFHKEKRNHKDHQKLWALKIVSNKKGKAPIKKQKIKLEALTKTQLDIIRGLIIAGIGDLRYQVSKKLIYKSYKEDDLEIKKLPKEIKAFRKIISKFKFNKFESGRPHNYKTFQKNQNNFFKTAQNLWDKDNNGFNIISTEPHSLDSKEKKPLKKSYSINWFSKNKNFIITQDLIKIPIVSKKYSFYIEDVLEKADFIYFCWKIIKTKKGLSWVNMRPRIIQKTNNIEKRSGKDDKSLNYNNTVYSTNHSLENASPIFSIPNTTLFKTTPSHKDNNNDDKSSIKKNHPGKKKEKLAFISFKTKQLITINKEFQIEKPKSNLKRSKQLPSQTTLKKIINETILSFWFLGCGYQRCGRFIFDVHKYSMDERRRLVDVLNDTFDFKTCLISDLENQPGYNTLVTSLKNSQFNSNNHFIFEITSQLNYKKKPETQIIVYKGNLNFQNKIKKILFKLEKQEYLFRKNYQKFPFENRHRLSYDFANEFKVNINDLSKTILDKLIKERGKGFELEQSSWSLRNLNEASLRKEQLINNQISNYPISKKQ